MNYWNNGNFVSAIWWGEMLVYEETWGGVPVWILMLVISFWHLSGECKWEVGY